MPPRVTGFLQYRMKNKQGHSLRNIEPHVGKKCDLRHSSESFKVVQARRARDEYIRCMFAHADEAFAGIFSRRKMNMGQFRNGMANRLIDGARPLTPMNMRHRYI